MRLDRAPAHERLRACGHRAPTDAFRTTRCLLRTVQSCVLLAARYVVAVSGPILPQMGGHKAWLGVSPRPPPTRCGVGRGPPSVRRGTRRAPCNGSPGAPLRAERPSSAQFWTMCQTRSTRISAELADSAGHEVLATRKFGASKSSRPTFRAHPAPSSRCSTRLGNDALQAPVPPSPPRRLLAEVPKRLLGRQAPPVRRPAPQAPQRHVGERHLRGSAGFVSLGNVPSVVGMSPALPLCAKSANIVDICRRFSVAGLPPQGKSTFSRH